MTPASVRLLAAVAIATAAALPATSQATAPPAGRDCDFLVASSPTLGEGVWTGQLNGGPLVAPGSDISIRCSIHVGNALHAGAAAAAATAGPQAGAVAVAAPVSFTADQDEVFALCTQATVDTTDWYWTGTEWTTDPAAACPVSETTNVPQPFDPIEDLLICLEYGGGLCDLPTIDDLMCRVAPGLGGVPGVLEFGENGDVYLAGDLFWDCPPYEWWG